MGDVLRIVTPLDPDECERRLRASLDGEDARGPRYFLFELPTRTMLRAVAVLRALSGSTSDGASVKVIVEGRVARDKSMFWVSRQVEGGPFVDSFAPRLYARSLSTGGGTELRIELRMARFVRAFLAVWVAAAIVLGGMLLYAVVAGWPSQGDTWVIFALPCFFLLAGYGLSRFSRSIARADREVLLQFIRRALDGTMEPDS